MGSQVMCCTCRSTGLPSEIAQRHAARREHRHVAVGQKEQVAGVIQNGRNVGGDEVLVFPQPDDHRRAVAGGHDLVRLVGGNHRQGKDAADLEHRLANGFFQRHLRAVAAGQILLDQVRDDLGVGLGQELMALFAQLPLQAE